MLVLVCGLVVFLGVHAWPMAPRLRERLSARLGPSGYLTLYSTLSVAGLGRIGWGYAQTRALGAGANPVLWSPPYGLRHLAFALMVPAVLLMVAAYVPSRIRDVAKHPMLASIKLWATAHLLVRGDLASVLLFASFLVWAVADRISVKQRAARGPLGDRVGTARGDAFVVGVGLAVYAAVVLYGHHALIGVPLVNVSFARP
jgi:uncharacterized membrane protein